MKIFSFFRVKRLIKTLSLKEKFVISILFAVAVSSGLFLLTDFYLKNTKLVPAFDGAYIEGELGKPRFLNPIYSESFDVDRDLTELLYSGLLKYSENGEIINDLVQDRKVSEDGKIYEFFLKEKLVWSDGQPLNADDIIFTVKIIQDPAYKSPLRAKWLGVETEKISDSGVRFKLKTPYAPFLETCVLKIIPKHVWENFTSENFALSPFNLMPVGSGPYMIKEVKKTNEGEIKGLDLVYNPYYHGHKPYISKYNFIFFENSSDLITAFKRGLIQGFSLNALPESEFDRKFIGVNSYAFSFPRYFGVFFNPEKNELYSEPLVREALNYAVNKNEIIEEILQGKAQIINSPLLPEIYGLKSAENTYTHDQAKAEELLDKAGYKKDEAQKRIKIVKHNPSFQFSKNLKQGSRTDPDVKELQKCLAEELEIEIEPSGYFGPQTKEAVIKFQEKYRAQILEPNNLENATGEVLKSTQEILNQICFPANEEKTELKIVLTAVNQPIMIKVAEKIKEQWEKIGAEVIIETYDISTLEREIIKPRNYDTLLFGEVLGAIPDPFPFWHSSQKTDPGLNLALYENEDCDKLLKEARESSDPDIRREKLEEFQEILLKDAPAVFLYNPDYLYLTSGKVKGIQTRLITDPSKRFTGIENWYIKEKRVWK